MIVFLVICLVVTCSVVSTKENQVKTKNGELLGSYMYTKTGRKVSAYQSIPFGKPPVGELRFEAPVPADPWEGIRNATEIHAICPQRDIYRRSELIEGEEDCLYLNVYSPQLSKKLENPLPVMVFFHGGGWLCGGGNSLWYGPKILLDRDVVLVVPNYRLGALGFLTTGDDVLPGNSGMKDQVLALRWVQENIGAFGGDPKKVTIFGESAGGASVQFHTVSPLSKGLFRNGIAQSGTAFSIWALAPEGEGVRNGRKLAKSLNCPTDCSEKMLECLKKIDANDIVSQDKEFMDWDLDPMIPFKPTIESNHEGAFLIEHPAETIKSGKVNIPLLVGLTTDDGALRAAGLFGNPHLIEEINNDFERTIPISLMYDKTAQNVDEVTKKIKKFYFKNKKITRDYLKDVVNMYTDGWFLNAIDNTVRLQKSHTSKDVYLYLFGHRGLSSFTEIFGDPHTDYGVCHADDLQYLFPVGEGLFPDKKPTEDDKKVAEIISNLWVNFATYGDPTPNTNELIKEKWLPVKTENLEYFFINANESGMRDGLYIDRVKFWRGLKSDNRLHSAPVKDEF